MIQQQQRRLSLGNEKWEYRRIICAFIQTTTTTTTTTTK
jgi:hypothetical protein